MNIINRSSVHLLYCYLVCLITVIYSVFKIANLTSDWLQASYFDVHINTPYHLQAENFSRDHDERYKNLTLEQLEEQRQQFLKNYAQTEPQRLKSKVLLELPYLFTALLALLIHIVLIFRVKKKI